jgi:hypothetical protein
MTLLPIDLPTDDQVRAELATVRVAVLEATTHVRSPRRSTRYRTIRAVIIAGTAAALLTAGAIAVARASQEHIASYATCFEHPSLDSRQHVFISNEGDLDPAELCGIVWRNDSWTSVSNGDPDDPNDGTAAVPPLVTCTLADGAAGVFPREGATTPDTDFCATLGLADWDSD